MLLLKHKFLYSTPTLYPARYRSRFRYRRLLPYEIQNRSGGAGRGAGLANLLGHTL
jgi:hypothetical protein